MKIMLKVAKNICSSLDWKKGFCTELLIPLRNTYFHELLKIKINKTNFRLKNLQIFKDSAWTHDNSDKQGQGKLESTVAISKVFCNELIADIVRHKVQSSTFYFRQHHHL